VEADYTVFTQLLDVQNHLVTSHDSPPAAGVAPTRRWQPGEVIVDDHTLILPGNIPSGEYRLLVGMYDTAVVRLPWVTSAGQPIVDDAILLSPVTVP
jgi:hypothetical protein